MQRHMQRHMQQHMQQNMEKQSHQAMQHLLQMMGIPNLDAQGSKHLSVVGEDAKKGKQRGGGRKAATGKNTKGKKRPLSAYVSFLCTNNVGCDESMDYGPVLPFVFQMLSTLLPGVVHLYIYQWYL